MEQFIAFAEAVQASRFGVWAAGSAIAYPLANTLHLLGLVMLVGGIGVVDLRVAGLFPRLPVKPLADALTPIAVAGLLLMAASGAVMFAADAVSLAGSPTFRWKLGLLAAALVNAIAFRSMFNGRIASWDRVSIPGSARIMALVSIALWLLVGMQGRLIAYS